MYMIILFSYRHDRHVTYPLMNPAATIAAAVAAAASPAVPGLCPPVVWPPVAASMAAADAWGRPPASAWLTEVVCPPLRPVAPEAPPPKIPVVSILFYTNNELKDYKIFNLFVKLASNRNALKNLVS